VLLLMVLFLLLRPRETTVTVIGHEWAREIRTEKFIPVIEEDWSVPGGAKVVQSFRDIHHYDQVLVGYETRYREVEKPVGTKRVKVGVRDLGNGYFEDIYETQTVYKTVRESYQEPVYKSVPVYATKYRYEIYRWKPDKTVSHQWARHFAAVVRCRAAHHQHAPRSRASTRNTCFTSKMSAEMNTAKSARLMFGAAQKLAMRSRLKKMRSPFA
jgi:hypothetical protein